MEGEARVLLVSSEAVGSVVLAVRLPSVVGAAGLPALEVSAKDFCWV